MLKFLKSKEEKTLIKIREKKVQIEKLKEEIRNMAKLILKDGKLQKVDANKTPEVVTTESSIKENTPITPAAEQVIIPPQRSVPPMETVTPGEDDYEEEYEEEEQMQPQMRPQMQRPMQMPQMQRPMQMPQMQRPMPQMQRPMPEMGPTPQEMYEEMPEPEPALIKIDVELQNGSTSTQEVPEQYVDQIINNIVNAIITNDPLKKIIVFGNEYINANYIVRIVKD